MCVCYHAAQLCHRGVKFFARTNFEQAEHNDEDSSGGGGGTGGHSHWINIPCHKSSTALDLIVLLGFLSSVRSCFVFVPSLLFVVLCTVNFRI